MASSGTAKALSVVLALGAVMMAFVAFGIGFGKPFRLDRPGGLPVLFAVLSVWLALYLVLACAVVFDAVRLSRRRDLGALQESANLVKHVAVPFFVLNLLGLTEAVLTVAARDSDHSGLDGFLLAVLFAVLTYVVILPTSAYGVAILMLLRKDDRIGRLFFGVNLLLHFLFVADVLSAVVVVEVARGILGVARRPGALSRNLLTGVLAVGSALAVVWLVFAVIFYLLHREHGDFLGYPGSFLAQGLSWLSYGVSVEFVLLVMVPIVPFVAFRTAVRLFLQGDGETLGRSARNVKLVMIPLFVQNFVLCAIVVFALTILPLALTHGMILSAGAGGVAFVGAFTAVGLVPAVIGTYLMLLPTSIFSITYLTLQLRHRAISPQAYVLHILLQLLFVTDIISTLVRTRRTRQLVTTPTPA